MKTGVLALQGDFEKHARAVQRLGHTCIDVKDADSLHACERLIIPGGESTTMIRLIEKLGLRAELQSFAKEHAVMGTCAGLIILARESDRLPFPALGLIDMQARRNAYGRQINSFIDTIQLELEGEKSEFEGVFIRAPKVISLGDQVQALGWHKQDVVLARQRNILVATFHPELTEDTRIHRYFLEMTW